jgi:hypothetical protein
MPKELDPKGEFTWRTLKQEGVWVETPIPGREGWMAAGLFFAHHDQIVLVELRVFPNVGRYPPLPRDWRKDAQTIRVGKQEWALGPPQIVRGKGEWSQKAKDLDGAPPGGIPVRLLQDIPLRQMIEEVHRRASSTDRAGIALPRGWANAVRGELPRPGRKGRDDHFYAVWARRYEQRVDNGSKTPLADLAREYGVPYATIRGYIDEARNRRGLLWPTTRGKAFAALTPKATKLLHEGTRKNKGGRRKG